jgi:glycosyltransferase involved in cell wall biosynthesis
MELANRQITNETFSCATDTITVAGSLRVLIVSNHRDAQLMIPSSSIWIDRQVTALRSLGVNVSTFDLGTSHSPIRLFKKWRELRSNVRAFEPHLIHARYGTVVAAVSVMAGGPSVITYCGSDLNPGAPVSVFRRYIGFLLSNLAALRARRLICVSPGLRQALWWRRSRVVIIPDGVDLDVFSPGPQCQARKEIGWNHEHPVVLFNPGNSTLKKGLPLAEAAMKVALTDIPSAQLHVISNVEPNRMPLFYRAADVLLCTSRYEGSPNVIKEALACNLPVVSTPVGDVSERLAGVKPSRIVPWDTNVIGSALTEILRSRQRCNGREHVTHLSLERAARQVISVYRSAL